MKIVITLWFSLFLLYAFAEVNDKLNRLDQRLTDVIAIENIIIERQIAK